MEQILSKLSEIELTAKRIMEDADNTKKALSEEMEKQCRVHCWHMPTAAYRALF